MGFHDRLKDIGTKAVADKMYGGYQETVTTYNAFDKDDVAKFKTRAQMRHETFNGLMKEFMAMQGTFRSSEHAKYATCFEAIAVVCQYRMEHGEPMYDIMAGIKLEE